MAELLRGDFSHNKHRIPYVSEITPYISTLYAATKNNKQPNGNGRGRPTSEVADEYKPLLDKIFHGWRATNNSKQPKDGEQSAYDQLKGQCNGGDVPDNFPSKAEVVRYQDKCDAAAFAPATEGAAAGGV